MIATSWILKEVKYLVAQRNKMIAWLWLKKQQENMFYDTLLTLEIIFI